MSLVHSNCTKLVPSKAQVKTGFVTNDKHILKATFSCLGRVIKEYVTIEVLFYSILPVCAINNCKHYLCNHQTVTKQS